MGAGEHIAGDTSQLFNMIRQPAGDTLSVHRLDAQPRGLTIGMPKAVDARQHPVCHGIKPSHPVYVAKRHPAA